MKRKEFLNTIIGAGVVAAASASGMLAPCAQGEERNAGVTGLPAGPSTVGALQVFRGNRTKTVYTHEVSATPEVVFPLLCPVREYDWIDGWSCNLVHSESGVAEDNCIFTTELRESPGKVMTWSAVRYEPPRLIQYVAVAPNHLVMRLNIELEPAGEKTRLHWTRIFTGLSTEGNQLIQHWTVESAKALGEKLEFFVKTGRMLQTSPK